MIDAVAEVHLAAERIGQVSVFENLQQHVHHVGVRLLDFVEQHHRVRTATHFLRQLAAFFVADIARRRTDQPRDVELLHVLAHVELDQRVLIAKHEFRQRARHQRLADARRAEEHKRADRTIRVFQVGAAATQRLADGDDRFVLADDGLAQLVFHAQQLFGVLLPHAAQRDARPLGDNLHDVVFGDDDLLFVARLPPFGHRLFQPVRAPVFPCRASWRPIRSPAP